MMEILQLLTIMLFIGTTAFGGSCLLRIAYDQYHMNDGNWLSVTVIGLACILYAVLCIAHFTEPFIQELGNLL